MPREIKFRVYDCHTKEMASGRQLAVKFRNGQIDSIRFDFDDHGYWLSSTSPIDQNRYKVMQFTGLKDKNGTEIYEEDILKIKATHGDWVVVVSFGLPDDSEGVYAAFGYNAPDTENYFLCLGDLQATKAEVVGNIYENPELLSQQTGNNNS